MQTNIARLIPNRNGQRLEKLVRCVFKRYVFLVLIIHFILLLVTSLFIVTWWKSGYVVILFFRAIALLRFLLLLLVLCISIEVETIIGVQQYYKRLRHFMRYPSLGLWLLLGFFDLYVLRVTILVVDIIFFFVTNKYISIQFLSYITLDLAYIAEFHVTLYILYNFGVVRNVRMNLLWQRKRKKKLRNKTSRV